MFSDILHLLITVIPQPGVEGAGQFDRIDAVDHVVDGSVAGHDELAGLLVAFGQSDGAPLVLVERAALVPDGLDVVRAADQPVDVTHRFHIALDSQTEVVRFGRFYRFEEVGLFHGIFGVPASEAMAGRRPGPRDFRGMARGS